jgi:hypothetical protein
MQPYHLIPCTDLAVADISLGVALKRPGIPAASNREAAANAVASACGLSGPQR